MSENFVIMENLSSFFYGTQLSNSCKKVRSKCNACKICKKRKDRNSWFVGYVSCVCFDELVLFIIL